MDANLPEWLKPFDRGFVDGEFRITDSEELKKWFDILLDKEINSVVDLEKWLEDYSELYSVIGEESSRRYVDMTCDTKSEVKKEAYLYLVREIIPKVSEWSNKLDRKFFDSPFRARLDTAKFGRVDQIISTSIELFTEKNIPLDVKLAELSQEYQGITGTWMVDFEGKKQTMTQMALYQLNNDRETREKAWKEVVKRRLQDKNELERIFDNMLEIRHEYALNLGLNDFREYSFKSKMRDYSPEDCLEFHDAIEKAVVPLVAKIGEKRKKEMGLDSLRPWDLQVDPLGRKPLSPFKEVSSLQNGVEEIFGKIDKRLGDRFGSIKEFMDLESRDGKAQGGYQTTFEEKRTPFIFTNAAGLHNDVITLLHEGGHAFHTLQCRNEPLVWYRHAGMEFSEVASMTQELFANPFLEVFYPDKETANRARLEQLERVVDIFPWVATIDAFQHWLYTHPGHAADERAKKWLEISSRFELKVNWDGLDPDIKTFAWHRQLHLFEVPFYYIEYAIAQLGALQFYRMYKNEPDAAVDNYLKALALGGSRGPASLFEAGGIEFNFSKAMLNSLMEMVEEEVESL